MRLWVVQTLRRWALGLPLSRSTKMRIAASAFRFAGSLFRGDPAYERYAASRRKPVLDLASTLIEGSPEALVADAIKAGFDLRPRLAPRVKVLIPAYGQFHHTLACLRSIDKHRGRGAFSVEVVDDASGDPNMSLLGLLPGVAFSANPVNLGFLQSCNRALNEVDTEFIYLLNNDTEVCSEWLDALIALMDRNPDCGLAGSKLISSDGRLQEAGGILWQDASAWNWGRGDDPSHYLYNFVRETDYVSGASMLIRTSLWRQLDGFDMRYEPAYCEDSDFAFRTRRVGMRVLYQPFSCVVHHEGLSHGTDINQGGKSHQVLNQKRFYERWRDVLAKEHYPNGEEVFLARDRSGSKPHILFMDHYVPQPDRDAGSRTVSEFMKAMIALGAHIVFWPQNGWYDPDYTPVLQGLGVEVVYGDATARGFEFWLEKHAGYLKAAVLSRPDVFEAFEPSLRRFHVSPIIYYGHDLHFARMQMQRSLYPDSQQALAIERMRRQETEIWERADHVLYPSLEEVKVVSKHLESYPKVFGKTSEVSKFAAKASVIQPYVFERNPNPLSRDQRKFLIFVAGFAHPPNEDAAMWLVDSIMPMVWKKAPEVSLKLVGSNPTEKVKNLETNTVQVTGYVSDQKLQELYNQALIALVPLRFGAGVKNKVIEAFAHGVPLVTTQIGMQGLDEAIGIALVADLDKDFAQAIVSLMSNTDKWYEQQARGLSFAGKFSALSMQTAWKEILN